MTLAAGTKLGTYEIVSPLGAGGMGEVYRARDPKLHRDVAVKVLSDSLARDAESLSRFEREARLLAAVDHPNIAVIHAIETEQDRPFLVMELIPGETLAERLAAGPLSVAEALAVAGQVANALEAAHEKGVVHRDLKPSNVVITPEGRVKVLDFGLAKSSVTAAGDSQSPTRAAEATRAGTVLGSPGYMSPEQARGRPIDRRTDIWGLGCLLFECLAGQPAFGGESTADSIAAILGREPDRSLLPADTPAEVRRLLGRCLEKDASRRLRDAGDVRLEIEAAQAALNRRPEHAALQTGWLVATVAVLLAVAVAAFLLLRRPGVRTAPPHPVLSQVTFAAGLEEFPAFSPSGNQIAYTGETGGVRQIFVKSLSSGEERRVTRSGIDEIQPAWSPDGESLVFVRSDERGKKLEPGDVFGEYLEGNLWSVELRSGLERQIAEKAFNPAFSPDGTRIAVDAYWAGPHRIWTLDRQGLNPQQVSSDLSEAVAHLRPRWSPDGRRIVFQNIERTKFDIRVVDLVTKKLTWVTNDALQNINPVWSGSGRFIYFSSYRSGGINIWRTPVSADGAPTDAPQQLTTGAGQDVEIALSRDGRRIAFSILNQNADVWRLPVSPETGKPTGSPQPVVATTREDSRGAWSPDGQWIAFNSDRTGEMNIWVASLADGSSRQLTRGAGGDFQPNWSPDAARIAFFSSREGTPDIWILDVRSGKLDRLTKTDSIDINPFFSPDGRTIAFQSDRSGRLEVWVMGSDGSNPRQLTTVGVSGHFLRWSVDGRSVIFRCPCSGKPQTMEVPLAGGAPQALPAMQGGAHISFSPDRSRIMDVVAHKVLWVSPLTGGPPEKVFEFDDADSRIDYPVWSPDGRWVLFDRFRPEGGDVWLMEKFE